MSKKQTAAQWLADKIAEILGDKCNELTQEQTLANHYAIKQAIQMEREQIEEAFNSGYIEAEQDNGVIDTIDMNTVSNASDYYTQTYGECTQQ